MNKLLGHLAQFASFSQQGELLCTQGMTFILRDPSANRAFTGYVSRITGTMLPDTLEWKPELVQTDGGRPDIEGRDQRGNALVKIEGKLGAEFGKGQLESYVRALQATGREGVLLVLVPGRRVMESAEHSQKTFGFTGSGPWALNGDTPVHVAVISWEQVIEEIASAADQSIGEELAQFEAMYRVFNGDDIEPITSDEEILAWREKETWWIALADLTTRTLETGPRVMPWKKGSGYSGYRYICKEMAPKRFSCYSLGVRDPFAGFTSPIWMCFHKKTHLFEEIRDRLAPLVESGKALTSGGHIWIPLNVPLNAGKEEMLANLVGQVTNVTKAAKLETPSRTDDA